MNSIISFLFGVVVGGIGTFFSIIQFANVMARRQKKALIKMGMAKALGEDV